MEKRGKRFSKRIISLFLAAGLLVMTGCAGKNNKSGAEKATKVRVGIVTNTMGVPAAYAMEKGYYKDENIEIEPVIFSTGSLVNEAMAANEIDIAFSGLASIFSLATGDALWIGEINTTPGLGIYVRPDSPILEHKGVVPGYENVYGSAETVKGIKILGPLGNVAQYCAANWIRLFGLTDQDVEIVHMDYGPAYQAFISGEGDAVSLNNPYTFQAEEKGMVCAATFEDATKTKLQDGIFGDKDFINNNRDMIVKFLKATYKACDELKDDNTRFDFSMKWFKENGKEYSETDMRREINLRKYLSKEEMTADNFVLGEGLIQIGDFYIEDGKIEESSREHIKTSIDSSLLTDVFGAKVKQP